MNFSLNKIARAMVPAVGLTFALGAYAQEQQTQPRADPAQAQTQQGQATSMALSKEIVTRMQQTLKDRGLYTGEVDGVWGEKTQSAVRQFQQSQNMEATGKVNAQTLAALGIQTGEMAQAEQPRTTASQHQDRAAADRERDAQAQATMGDTMRLSQLVGKKVRNAQGEDIGEISDLVIDVNNERVHYAILSFGGFMGFGEKKFAYPMRTLNVSPGAEHVVLNVPKERLERAPGFEDARQPTWGADDSYQRDVDRYFGDMVQVEPRPNMLLRRASTLMDANVNDARGENVGDIEDVLVNTADGSVRFVVVAFERGWTEPDRYTTVPLRAFRFVGDDNDVALRLNQQQIGTAPGFARDRWNDMGPDYGARVDRWFTNLGEDTGTAAREAVDPVTDTDQRR